MHSPALLPARSLPAFLSLLAAAALSSISTGCSLGMELTPLEEELVELPPLLEFETPLPDLVYSAADDERPDAPGLELLVRVRVRDLENGVWLEDIALGAAGAELVRAPIHEDWRGLRCAEVPLVVFPDEDGARVELVASAGGGLGEVRQQLLVGAAGAR